MRQPLNERSPLEAVMAVVRVAVNRLCVHIVHRNGREGHNVNCSVARDRRVGHAFDRDQVRMIDGGIRHDGFQTEQLSETVGNFYRGFVHGVAWTATRLGGRSDLDAIQAVLATNGRRGGFVEEIIGRPNLISRGDYGNAYVTTPT